MKENRLTALLLPLLLAAAVCPPLSLTARAAGLDYVTDAAGILAEEERADLETRAASLAEAYSFGVYIVTVDDYRALNAGDMGQCAEAIYQSYSLGYGADHDGELLLMSMDDRDYWLSAYGYGNTVFTDYGKDLLAEAFLDNFNRDDWYGGFRDYLDESGAYLRLAAEGTPVDTYGGYYEEYNRGPDLGSILLLVIFLPCLLSGLICLGLRAKMRSVRRASGAGTYLAANGCDLQVSEDVFTHVTQTRVRVQQDPGPRAGGGGMGRPGGTTINSRGFSGKGGKF